MDLSNLAFFQKVLEAIGLTSDEIAAWVEKFKSEHPDSAGMADAFLGWLTPKITRAGTIAVANAAAADLFALIQSGAGPINKETDPTTFA